MIQFIEDKPALNEELLQIVQDIDFDCVTGEDDGASNLSPSKLLPQNATNTKKADEIMDVTQLNCGIYSYRMNRGKVSKFETIGDYYIMNTIGNGTYGKVRLAIKTATKEKVYRSGSNRS